MHILFVLEHYYPYIGGAEKLFKNLCEALVAKGDKVTVVTTKHHPSLPETEDIEHVHVIRLPFSNRFLFTFFSFPWLIRYVKGCDIVHTTSYNAALPAFLAAKFCRKPVFITFHEVWNKLWFRLPFYSTTQKYLFYLFEQLILKLRFNKYIAVSAYTQKCLTEMGIPAIKICKIYNGVDYDGIEKKRISGTKIANAFCFYGRLGASKGMDILLESIALLKKAGIDFKCQMIIPKYPSSIFRKLLLLIDKLDIKDEIEFLHELSEKDLFHTIQKCGFVVIPSYSEGFCYVAAECAAIDIPVVSSSKGALAETVSGNFIQLNDLNAICLKEAIIKGINGEWENRPKRMFTMESMIDAYLDLYHLK